MALNFCDLGTTSNEKRKQNYLNKDTYFQYEYIINDIK